MSKLIHVIVIKCPQHAIRSLHCESPRVTRSSAVIGGFVLIILISENLFPQVSVFSCSAVLDRQSRMSECPVFDLIT